MPMTHSPSPGARVTDEAFDLQAAAGPGLLESMWRYRVLVVVLGLLGALAGLLFAQRQAPVYQAESQLLLQDPGTAGLFGEQRVGASDPSRYVRNQAEFIRTGAVYPTASLLLNERWTAGELAERVAVEAQAETNLISIIATGPSAQDAAEIADAVGLAYETVVRQRVEAAAAEAIAELEARNTELRQQADALVADLDSSVPSLADAERAAVFALIADNESRIQQLTVDATLFGSGVDVFAPADMPAAPVRPRPRRLAATGLFVGLIMAAAFSWWRNSTNEVAQDSREPGAALDAPLLGEVPSFGKVGVRGQTPTVTAPHSAPAEAYQFIVSSLAYGLAGNDDAKVILITSARPGDGKTVTALNIAVAAKGDGRRVLVTDADSRALGLTHLCGVRGDEGTSLYDWQPGNQVAQINGRLPQLGTIAWLSEEMRLPIVTVGAGIEDPASYFRTHEFRRAIGRLRADADLVVIDAPPLLGVSDASTIASQADGIVIVVDRGTPMPLLHEMRRRLEFIGTPVLGYVFNRTRTRSALYTYAYGSRAHGMQSPYKLRWWPSQVGARNHESRVTKRFENAPSGEEPRSRDETASLKK